MHNVKDTLNQPINPYSIPYSRAHVPPPPKKKISYHSSVVNVGAQPGIVRADKGRCGVVMLPVAQSMHPGRSAATAGAWLGETSIYLRSLPKLVLDMTVGLSTRITRAVEIAVSMAMLVTLHAAAPGRLWGEVEEELVRTLCVSLESPCAC